MSDYVYVPKVVDEGAVYTNGIIIMSKDDIGDYRIGYVSNTQYNIKAGLYTVNDNIYIVFTSSSIVTDFDLYFVGPNSSTLFNINVINSQYEGGYYAEENYTIIPTYTATTIFDSRSDFLESTITPMPGPDSGVVVTAIATPNGSPVISSGVVVTAIARMLDPNDQGGTSDTGGGTGTYDETSDVIPVSSIPNISAVDSGFITLFRPTLSELNDLGSYLWSNITDFIENMQKLFSNPMDYFITFHIVPCIPEVGQARNIKLGTWSTIVSMPPVLSQWYEHNCGIISISEYWGSALDYAPNTKISLFLPFIGSVTLNTDEVMGRNINLRYRIDLLSGQCVAMLGVSGADNNLYSVLYQFTGECAVSIPLTGSDWSRVYSAAIGAVGTAITGGIGAGFAGAAAGGATSALASVNAVESVAAIGTAFSNINATSKGVKGVTAMRENMQQAATIALNAGREAANIPARVSRGVKASRIANTINNTIGSVMGAKYQVSHSGTISGPAGMLGVKTPYVLIEYPNQSLATNYKHFVGYPSNIYSKLGELKGYTECEQVIPMGVSLLNDSEMGELLDTIKTGVYLNFDQITQKGNGVVLYNYDCSPNTIGKSARIVGTYTGVFREAVSISSPTFTIERNSPLGFNYVYIEAFDRFYYVSGVSADSHNLITISCAVDVLETAGINVKDFEAIIKRQEFSYNLYLDDGIFKAYQNTKHKIIGFPNPFSDFSYILGIAGNSDS